jgi:hypothetical protein
MSGDHAKKEMVTGEKPATSHGKAPSGESDNKVKGVPFTHQVASEQRKEKENEEGGLLRDLLFITFYIRLRRAIRHF